MAKLGFELAVCVKVKVSVEWGRFEECFGKASTWSTCPALLPFFAHFKGALLFLEEGGREVKWASKWSLLVGG